MCVSTASGNRSEKTHIFVVDRNTFPNAYFFQRKTWGKILGATNKLGYGRVTLNTGILYLA